MKPFMNKDFLLESDTAQDLYHNHAKRLPIIANGGQKEQMA